jgi:hypothetical protein
MKVNDGTVQFRNSSSSSNFNFLDKKEFCTRNHIKRFLCSYSLYDADKVGISDGIWNNLQIFIILIDRINL